MMMMRSQKVILPLLAVMLAIRSSQATTYTVGGNGGWELGTDLQTWVSNQAFSLGDELVFQYSPGHDVSEVTKEDYHSCQSTSPIQTFTGGSTVIPLTSPGKRYFICSVPGHCSTGMKLEVNTLSPSESISIPPAVTPTIAQTLDGNAPTGSPTPSKLAPASFPIPLSESSNSPSTNDGNHLSENSANSMATKLKLNPNAVGIYILFLGMILGM